MSGLQNNIVFGGGFKLEASSSADIINMQAPFSTNVSNVNYTGNPEGIVSANPSSFCHDPVSGVVYLKLTGTGNTGWTPIINPSAPLTITGNSGLPLVPTAGNWNIVGSGSLTSTGLTSTLTFSLTGLTNHNVLVGAGTDTITKVAPSSTAGIAFVSNGSTVDPSFTTTLVVGGGTGITSYNQGDLIYASSTTILATLAKNTTATRYLANTGASNNPAWDQINLSNGVTNTLPVANGGTGAITLTGVVIGNGVSPMTGNPITQHDVLVGGASNAITSVAPTATAGIPLVSNGAAVDPSFSTATVPGGGTGLTTTTPFALIAGGTTSTANLQQVAALGSSGQVLTSNGAGALPTFQSAAAGTGVNKVIIQTFIASGTYTPSSGMLYCDVEVVGGGGGGGAIAGTSSATGAGGGGGAGGYSRKIFNSATIGASQVVTIGTAGSGGVAGANNGLSGGNTTFGALMSATGGAGGLTGGLVSSVAMGGNAGSGVGGSFNTTGTCGNPGLAGAGNSYGGGGGSSFFGGGAFNTVTTGTTSIQGQNANSYGGGGSGAANTLNATSRAGGNGFSGIVVITEYTT